jgi:hypothetical protein
MVLADLPDPVVGGATTAELRATTIRLRMADLVELFAMVSSVRN